MTKRLQLRIVVVSGEDHIVELEVAGHVLATEVVGDFRAALDVMREIAAAFTNTTFSSGIERQHAWTLDVRLPDGSSRCFTAESREALVALVPPGLEDFRITPPNDTDT